MSSPTQWTWVWANSGSWWWTGKPGLMQSMGLQRVRHDLATQQEDIRTSSWRVNQIQEKMKPKLCWLDSKFPGRSAVSFVFGVEMLALTNSLGPFTTRKISSQRENSLPQQMTAIVLETAVSPRRQGWLSALKEGEAVQSQNCWVEVSVGAQSVNGLSQL